MKLSRRQFNLGSTASFASAITSSFHSNSTCCAQNASSKTTGKSSVPTHRDTFALIKSAGKIPVIFDTDIGGDIDDTWALLYLLKCPELDLKLLATDARLGDYRTSLAAKFLTEVGRQDVPLAISVGRRDGKGNQQDWVGDYHYSSYEGPISEDAADAIIRTIKTSPVPVTLICVGAVPNISEALRRDPSICKNARFVGMHGAIHVGYGGHLPVVPEANVRNGIEPLRDTFAADWECSITPLDTCGIVNLDGDRYRTIYNSPARGIKELMANYRAWLTRVRWLNAKPNPTTKSTTLFDLVAVTMAYSEDFMEMETLSLSINDTGVTLINEVDGHDVRCAMRWKNLDKYKDHITERLTSNL
ncbi:Pyrimidine-specific ribonucleoside hydrolase RihA [Planctomycetes bacterium CA13]|uniref:Pyrimidine-specific ribonucleoside hydrolase RihA n=1 Tax=Novipirellula herctigrandis TaxID=2527986 RepID=A0A5C5Z5I0_9BACT|nr:Pyrimidine-specific ribonucleoside hydrolase RihA [Planctomycetes bacterium CA13]